MKTVSVAQAATAQEAVLPARVQEALRRARRCGEGRTAGAERSASGSGCWPS
jgi:hypothetical protein